MNNFLGLKEFGIVTNFMDQSSPWEVTVSTRASHCTLSWASWIQSTPLHYYACTSYMASSPTSNHQ